MPYEYCCPLNAGLASKTDAVCRRIGRLMTALDNEINSWVVSGPITEDLRTFRFDLMRKLENDGFTLSYDGKNKMTVRPPGHAKPFARQIRNTN